MERKISREQAEQLADALLAQQPRVRDSALARALPAIRRLVASRPMKHEEPSPFASPASPAWDSVHPKINHTK